MLCTRVLRRLGTPLVLAGLAAAAVGVAPGAAVAAPAGSPTTPEQAAALVADRSRELEAVTEQVLDAQYVLQEQQAAVVGAEQAVATAQAGLAGAEQQMRTVARSVYTGDQLSRFGVMMTSDSAADFIAQVSTLDVLAGHADQVVDQAAAAASVAAEAKAASEAATAAAQQTLDAVTAQQADLQAQIADYQARFEQLDAAQQAAVVREVAGQQLEAPAEVVAVPRETSGDGGDGDGDGDGDGASTQAAAADTAAVQTAIDTAMAQLGDPYVWGAGGPNAFDCSGLMQYAYAAAGIDLPHSSRIQSTMGTPVARADLQPGDLVFFYSPVSHVGMYIGNGMMVHAPTFGSPVRVASVDMSGYVGARRIA